MNTISSPLAMVLLKWTVLLALAWGANGLLRERHSRWRQILWRGILCVGFLVPVMQFAPVPVLQIPVFEPTASPLVAPADLSPAIPSHRMTTDKPAAAPLTKIVEPNAVANKAPVTSGPISRVQIPWQKWPLMIWALVAALAGFRLIRLQRQLNRIRRESHPAGLALQTQVREIQGKLGVKHNIDVRVSGSISSCFACGLWKPAILLPQKMALKLSADETSALLLHEVAHFYRRDLFWCVAWRWMQAVFWFHPLVWKIPAAHSLACEQECDRMASGGMPERADYSQLLARLALRVLALPKVETQLALNASSQIARRLKYLRRGEAGSWNWKYSMVAVVLVMLLFALATGYELSQKNSPHAWTPAAVKFKKVLVVVQDKDGKPIEGATVQPFGFRVQGIHGADAYNWKTNDFGPPETATSDKDGKAWVRYPVMGIPEEKELTGGLLFLVTHPEYCTVDVQTFSIDGSDNPIQMARGIVLEVSGYYGANQQPVTEIVPNLSEEGVRTNDWLDEGSGVLSFHKLSPGGHLIQLMGRLPSGKIVYSETTTFTAVEGKPCKLELEMKPGIRLEGRLDDSIPRPVKNARVMIDIRPPQYPVRDVVEDYYAADDKYGGGTARKFWHSYRPINEDGTFTFESVPPGEADVVVLGDGFCSKTFGTLHNRVNGVATTNGPTIAIPQAFPLTGPVTKIEVKTEPTATLDFTAVTKSGKPIQGVFAGIYPSAFRMWGRFGWVKPSSEETFRQIPQLPDPVFTGHTDENGKLVLANLPAEEHGLDVYDSQYQVPLQDVKGWRDRHIRTQYAPGMTNQMKLVMEPIGTDFIGKR